MSDLIELLRQATVVDDPLSHAASCARVCPRDGLVLEFGVFQGKSANRIADEISPRLIHGFDSFRGLPEPWLISDSRIYPTGHFALHGRLPDVRPNVRLVHGWFKDTIPLFLTFVKGQAAFINIDADLYSSALTILSLLDSRIVPGTIIRFDEFYDRWSGPSIYPLWKDGEHKALLEWVSEFRRNILPLSRDSFQGAAFVVSA